jgi:hypothetical protein
VGDQDDAASVERLGWTTRPLLFVTDAGPSSLLA